MGKSKSIGPNVARILAEKIVEAIKNSKEDKKDTLQKINEEISNSAEVKKGLILMEQLKKVNTQLNTKYGKYLNQGYKNTQFFSVTDKNNWVSDYMLADTIKLPSVESIRDEIVLESAFSEAGSPEEVIAKYIKKYTSKK